MIGQTGMDNFGGMKFKVRGLEGAMLDAAVAKALGFGERLMAVDGAVCVTTLIDHERWISNKHGDGMLRLPMPPKESHTRFSPSTDWGHGGPIIEREQISIRPVFFEDYVECGFNVEYWEATCSRDGTFSCGNTPLVAAMRAYVASKFGEEVELRSM